MNDEQLTDAIGASVLTFETPDYRGPRIRAAARRRRTRARLIVGSACIAVAALGAGSLALLHDRPARSAAAADGSPGPTDYAPGCASAFHYTVMRRTLVTRAAGPTPLQIHTVVRQSRPVAHISAATLALVTEHTANYGDPTSATHQVTSRSFAAAALHAPLSMTVTRRLRAGNYDVFAIVDYRESTRCYSLPIVDYKQIASIHVIH